MDATVTSAEGRVTAQSKTTDLIPIALIQIIALRAAFDHITARDLER